MRISLAGFAVLLAASPARAVHDNIDTTELLQESRRLATSIAEQVRGELTAELARTGPLRAILVCKYSVPEITSRISRQTGTKVTRVSLRPRNPALGTPDAWEQQVLLNFEKQMGSRKGDKAELPEFSEVVHEPGGHFFRYMRAIPTEPACLACHGEKLTEAVKSQLRADYPFDQGRDYRAGQLRGAVSIKKPL